MFTGLIEDLGTLREIHTGADRARLTVATGLPMAELALGESIAVNGVCLTVTAFADGTFTADVSPETMGCTTLGQLARGAHVNLERALRLSDRLGGHMVTGHIDGQGRIVERRKDGNAWRFKFQADAAVSSLLVAKGSITIDGISLTVNEVSEDTFSLAIIPLTLAKTTLQDRNVGDEVNIETDLIGKYVARFLHDGSTVKPQGVTMDLLAKNGFL
ncbi:MAG: riboflavin synthase [Desulfuromonadales bacterium]|nr:riboflavin synthase [Desulfuromonadales bacterium]